MGIHCCTASRRGNRGNRLQSHPFKEI